MAITNEQRERQRRVLDLIGIPLWQRSVGDEQSHQDLSVQTNVDKKISARDLSQQGVADSSSNPAADIVLPSTLEAVYGLQVSRFAAKDAASSQTPSILIRFSDKPLDPHALLLLERMMAAIDVQPDSWEIHDAQSASTGIEPADSSMVELRHLCETKNPSSIILLIPQSTLSVVSESLLSACDSSHKGTSASDLVGYLPATRMSFCCLSDPEDLLHDGSLKRHAWDTLQALRQAIQQKQAFVSTQSAL